MSVRLKIAERPPPSRKRRVVQLLLLILLAALAMLFFEHWRGERALRAWKTEMTKRGEIFDANTLWPTPDPASHEFSNQLAAAVEGLPERLTKFGGSLTGLNLDESGRPVRGSKQARPPCYSQDGTWRELELARKQAEPSLELIRRLMKNPPRSIDGDIAARLEPDGVSYFGHIRRSAQALHTGIINDLHRGDLNTALENLEALQNSTRLYVDEPALMIYMIRVALVGLVSDAYWDALQEDGWTELQLARLQKACESNVLLTQIPHVLAAERVGRLHATDWFASHGYQTWIRLFADVHRSFGSKVDEMDTDNWRGWWRQWVFHPTWSYAWRAQDELDYLQYSQQELGIVREAVQRESWADLREKQTATRNGYRRPFGDWRFYRSLPLHDIMSEIVGGNRSEKPECPYPDFSRAWFAAAQNLTRHEMVKTMIALKRYQLRAGELPPDLNALVPGYLPAVPRDFMDGRPLRYRRTGNGSWVLYSVGEDARDDGGDARPVDSSPRQQRRDAWSGRDWVWPQIPAVSQKPKA